jgi:hypothetical protein
MTHMVLYHKKSDFDNTLLIGITVSPRVHAVETTLTVMESTYLFLAVVTRKPSSQRLLYRGIM